MNMTSLEKRLSISNESIITTTNTTSPYTNQISSISTSESSSKTSNGSSAQKKSTHSEIEKRRRQKMNKHLNELACHLPCINQKNKKIDKLTILKLAVQHLKSLKASNARLNDSFVCQNFMKPIELQSLVLNEKEDFLIVIKCDSNTILFVSDTCSNSIGFNSSEMIDKNFLDFIHSADQEQVCIQLSLQEKNISNENKNSLLKTGERRSFACQMLNGLSRPILKRSNQFNSNEPDYKLVHFVGYLRSDYILKYENNHNININDQTGTASLTDSLFRSHHSSSFIIKSDDENKMNNYIVAYVQVKSKINELEQSKFTSKHDMHGNFIHVEPSVFSILNYLPTDFISQSLFNFVHMDDIQMLKSCFQEAISKSPAKIQTKEYRFRMGKNKNYSMIQSLLFALKNPFNNNFEYILMQNKFCSLSLIPHHQSPQQQKKKSIQPTSSSHLAAMPMTPSPEEDENYNNNNNYKYTSSILAKKVTNNNNNNFKFKQKPNNFDNNNNNNLQTYLPISINNHNNEMSMYNNQVRINSNNVKDTNFNLTNNLFNEQFTYDFTENLNDFLISKNPTINHQSTTNDEKRQNSYNLMINNNSIQENTDMLMEILKNENSLHSNLNNQIT